MVLVRARFLVVAAIGLAACGGESEHDDGGSTAAACELAWVEIDLPPELSQSRYDHAAVWTGSELFVWGGLPGGIEPLQTVGWRYSPELEALTAVSSIDAPSARDEFGAYWTGQEVVIAPGLSAEDGGAYDVARDTWRR